MDTLTVNNMDLKIKEHNGQRVVTLKDIDMVHGRPEGTARRNFNSNKKHMLVDVDYFVRNSSEAKSEFGIAAPNGLTLITETGYLMLVKSFTDDLAWTVQRELVNTYFKTKKALQVKPEIVTYEYNDLSTVTLRTLEESWGIDHAAICSRLKKKIFIPNNDYFILVGDELEQFKKDNPSISKFTSSLTLVSHKGVKKLINDLAGFKKSDVSHLEELINNAKINIRALDALLDIVHGSKLNGTYFGLGSSVRRICHELSNLGTDIYHDLSPEVMEA